MSTSVPPAALTTPVASAGDVAQLRAELADVRAEQSRLREEMASARTRSDEQHGRLDRLDRRINTVEESIKTALESVKAAVAADSVERKRWTILGASIGAGSVYAIVEVAKGAARAKGILP